MSNKYPVICLERVIGYYSKGLYIVSENLMLTVRWFKLFITQKINVHKDSV
ncbi:hypothetical protein [Chryseobacterium sp.]|uniref:hypothetical protein n=1 Tax=Chryseobacterium sp. TaxID=1871047 RepID=UPI0025BF408B|nr:hypothetical protein [Chryseobacterium sp.]MBV8326634.1 hypothetical protein [Chryseobacterium sp.]